MDEASNPLENPHLLALVGDDPLRLQELIAIVSHMWETAWAHGAFPDAPSGHSVIRPAPDPGLDEPLPSQYPCGFPPFFVGAKWRRFLMFWGCETQVIIVCPLAHSRMPCRISS